MHTDKIDLFLGLSSTDVSRDVEVEIMLFFNLVETHDLRIAVLFFPVLIGFYDFVDMLLQQRVLPFSRLVVLGRIDEENVIGVIPPDLRGLRK
nr:hypothetical protein [Paracoccus seriniphilus]